MADTQFEQEGLKHLERIEGELTEIKENSGSWKGWFVRGILQGAGIIIGTILAAVLLGWALSILGIIPGLSDLIDYFRRVAVEVRSF